MASMAEKSVQPVTRSRPNPADIITREFWISIAISVIWIAVAVAAIWGGDFVSATSGGTSTTTTIPSGIGVALFASIATWGLAKYALRAGGKKDDEDKD